jgi:hypothetical protein
MKRSTIAAAILSGAMVAVTPVPQAFGAPAPQERRDETTAKHEYHFRQEDAAKLKGAYKGRAKVDMAHRENLVAGGRLPGDWRGRIEPVPQAVIAELPAIPAGCAIGYLDGYCVVYDPGTLEIVDVIDLQ